MRDTVAIGMKRPVGFALADVLDVVLEMSAGEWVVLAKARDHIPAM